MSLEGKYFGFEFSADYVVDEREEWSALAIFRVLNGNLEDVFHPCDVTEEQLSGIEKGSEFKTLGLKYLQKLGVKEIYSVLDSFSGPKPNQKTLWLTREFVAQREYPEDGDNTWYEFRWLYKRDHREVYCKEHGIELKEYSE